MWPRPCVTAVSSASVASMRALATSLADVEVADEPGEKQRAGDREQPELVLLDDREAVGANGLDLGPGEVGPVRLDVRVRQTESPHGQPRLALDERHHQRFDGRERPPLRRQPVVQAGGDTVVR